MLNDLPNWTTKILMNYLLLSDFSLLLSWQESVFVDSLNKVKLGNPVSKWEPKPAFAVETFQSFVTWYLYEVRDGVESLWVGESNKSFLDEARKLKDCISGEKVKKSKSSATFTWCGPNSYYSCDPNKHYKENSLKRPWVDSDQQK